MTRLDKATGIEFLSFFPCKIISGRKYSCKWETEESDMIGAFVTLGLNQCCDCNVILMYNISS